MSAADERLDASELLDSSTVGQKKLWVRHSSCQREKATGSCTRRRLCYSLSNSLPAGCIWNTCTVEHQHPSIRSLVDARLPLFAGEALLVLGENKKIMAFSTAGSILNREVQVQIIGRQPSYITTWCFLKDKGHLIVSDDDSKELVHSSI